MGLDEFLAESASRIDVYLDDLLPRANELPESLHEGMRYAVFSGGKRLRPALVFAAAHACGLPADRALPAAAAVELVHTYSLVHDDLPAMDDDDLRRGRPTVHIKYGEANAILVGDALLTAAFGALAQADLPRTLFARLADAAGSRALVGGQVDDLGFRAAHPTLELVRSIHDRKTASLFRFSAWAPGAIAGRPARELESLDRFGLAYGRAFQLVDDLLDDDPDECSVLRVCDEPTARAHLASEAAEALAAADTFGRAGLYLRGLASALCGRLT